MKSWTRGVVPVIAAAVLIVGCAKREQAQNKDAPGKKADLKEETKHDGWWCDEHGIPEAECSMCDTKVAKAFKAKGDWCKEHDRAKSQCFICEPSLREKYAALYKAKYGKEPPPPEDNMRK
jgi:hypothetical protein